MSDINDWDKLDEEDKKNITAFISENSAAVRGMMRNKYPSLYIGRNFDQVAKGWLMIAGLTEVMKFISDNSK